MRACLGRREAIFALGSPAEYVTFIKPKQVTHRNIIKGTTISGLYCRQLHRMARNTVRTEVDSTHAGIQTTARQHLRPHHG